MPSVGLNKRRVKQLGALLAIFAAFAAQLVGALLAHLPVFVTAAAAGLAVDLYLRYRQPALLSMLSRVRFDVTVRQLLRDMLILLGLLRIDGIEPLREQAPLTVALLFVYALHFLCQGVAVMVRRSRTLPVVTRNIDASALRLCAAPPRILARRPGHRLLAFSVPATTGLLVTAVTGDIYAGAVGLGLSLLLMAAGTAHLVTWLLPGKRPASKDQTLEWLDGWLEEYRPTVAMYFSGGTSSAYQANMWLSTLSALDGKPLIVLRERFMVQKIQATDVPIICIPRVAHMFALESSTLKMMLHPANSGKTSQVLRIPSIKHAFTNHGESDKLSSCNPYAKAYDEVWVAGPAARERYRQAEIGVDDKDVVEVGRPQLAPIQPWTGAPEGTYTTVLYAPTWEGWDGNPGNTSVVLAGENLVRALLEDDGVRLLYKPHPMTGSVDPEAGAADRRIRAMITEAAAGRSGPRPGVEAVAELDRRKAELDRLTSSDFRTGADELERMMVQGRPEDGRAALVAAATEAWEAAYWASFPEWQHQIVVTPRLGIYSCFNQSHLLISDVSSVVSDYLHSEKPYAVANTSGMTEKEFRAAFPTVRAAAVLSPDASGVAELLESVRFPEKDQYTKARTELKAHLLGPSDPPSLVRFNAAAVALCAEADERRALMTAHLTPGIPSQRGPGSDETAAAEARNSGPNGSPEPVTT